MVKAKTHPSKTCLIFWTLPLEPSQLSKRTNYSRINTCQLQISTTGTSSTLINAAGAAVWGLCVCVRMCVCVSANVSEKANELVKKERETPNDFSPGINHCRRRKRPTAVMDGWNFSLDVFSIADNLVVQAFSLFLCSCVAEHFYTLTPTYARFGSKSSIRFKNKTNLK